MAARSRLHIRARILGTLRGCVRYFHLLRQAQSVHQG